MRSLRSCRRAARWASITSCTGAGKRAIDRRCRPRPPGHPAASRTGAAGTSRGAACAHRVLARPLLGREPVEGGKCSLGGGDPRRVLFGVLFGAVIDHPEPADQRRQRQALDDQREEDHTVGEEDDQLAPGSGAPRSVSSGSARAAASVTAPRIPDHATTVRGAQPTRRSTWAGRRSSARMTYGVVWTQRNRVPTTAAIVAKAYPARVRLRSRRPRRGCSAAAGRSARTGPRSAGTRRAPRPRSPASASARWISAAQANLV